MLRMLHWSFEKMEIESMTSREKRKLKHSKTFYPAVRKNNLVTSIHRNKTPGWKKENLDGPWTCCKTLVLSLQASVYSVKWELVIRPVVFEVCFWQSPREASGGLYKLRCKCHLSKRF